MSRCSQATTRQLSQAISLIVLNAFRFRIALNSARERRCPVLRRYTQPQNNTQQEERQFLTIAPTRAPYARGKCEAPRSPRRQRGPAWRVQVARKVEDAQEERGLSLSPQRQREGPWRMRGVRKDFDAYFGTPAFAAEDSEGPPGEFRWRERLRTRTSVRDETLERQLDRQTGPQRRAVSLAVKPAEPITSCPCRRPGLLRRERRGRDRPWGSR